MTSFIWWRSPEEAYSNPYEYDSQEQFVREAELLLKNIFNFLMTKNGTFARDDRSKEKAIWMLFVDGNETLRDCLSLLVTKKHRLASRLFRDVVETMDLATYFSSNDQEKDKYVDKWYDNEVVPNRVFRRHVSDTGFNELSNAYKEIYSQLSKLNHRTYRSLAYSYLLRRGQLMVYEDEFENNNLLKLPHPISMYYALLAEIINRYTDRLIECNLVSPEEMNTIWGSALEPSTVPRRFIDPKEYYKMRMKQTQDDDDIT